MIVTRQWLQEYIDISKISTQDICKALNSIGLEVDSTTRILIPNGVVVAKVLDVQKHENADKLNVCQVDIGTKIEQIVCGASNVAKDQYVAVATVGAVLGDNFKIKKAKLRGVESNGMICSSTEIGLPKLDDGIMVLDDSIGELQLGKELSEYLLLNDELIEIELTANRGDCLSINGVARELATYFNIALKNIDPIINTNNKGIGQVFDVHYDTNCEANLIYKAADISAFKLQLLYKVRAAFIDEFHPIDIQMAIAYSTHSTGVLINIYNKSIATEQTDNLTSISVKKDKDGFDTVSGKKLLSIIGVDAGVIPQQCDEIIIEASYINPELLAQKVFDKKRETNKVYYRASRGSEPNLEFGIDNIITLLSLNGGTIYNGSKNFINDIQTQTINIKHTKLTNIIGETIPMNKIIQILSSLGFGVKQVGQDTLSITVPDFRHDIENIADITEEIVRMVGIDNIKSKPLLLREMNNINKVSNQLALINELRLKAISNGFFETITYVFSNKSLLQKYNFQVVEQSKDILNPIVSELNTFRTTLALNLIQAVQFNTKQGYKSIGLFENGIVFDKNRTESKVFGFVFSGYSENESIKNSAKPSNIDLFEFAQKISNTIGDFQLQPMNKIDNDFIHPYQNGQIIQNNKQIGILYKLHPTVAQDFDISNDTFYAQIYIDKLQNDTILATNISKYQASKRDLSIVAPKDLQYKKIKNLINSLKIPQIKQFNLIDIYSDKDLQDNESLTIRFVLQSDEKTFQEHEINEIMDKIVQQLQEQLGITLR